MTVTEFTCADCLAEGQHGWYPRYKVRLCTPCALERQGMDLLVAETAHEDRIRVLRERQAQIKDSHERRN